MSMMSQTHLHTVAEEKLEKQNIVQNHFHADVCYHLPIDQGQDNKELFQASLFLTLSSSPAVLFPVLAYDIQILEPT